MQDIWQSLSQDAVLNTVERIIKEKLSNLLIPRNSYVNRVYELQKAADKEKIIVKFYRPDRWNKEQILEEHTFLGKLAANEVPVIPPLKYDNNTLFFFDN
ncbi:MAG: phosphotransferase, partial [Candidatus Margulisbacteria bacterium]|nr:phosphotransferase [Candidatus Margulisiibacteriota bacterium]